MILAAASLTSQPPAVDMCVDRTDAATIVDRFTPRLPRIFRTDVSHPPPGLVFPLACAVGGALLLTHSHALANVKEEQLAELSHVPIAILGIAAGWARWLELRLPPEDRWLPARIWPVCFLLVGFLLLIYRES